MIKQLARQALARQRAVTAGQQGSELKWSRWRTAWMIRSMDFSSTGGKECMANTVMLLKEMIGRREGSVLGVGMSGRLREHA